MSPAAVSMTVEIVEASPTELPCFAHLPSVGTWLLPPRLPVRQEAAVVVDEDEEMLEDTMWDVRVAEEEPYMPMSARVTLGMQRKVTGAVSTVVGAAQFGADVFCEKWQATDDAATRALFASEEYLSKKADMISEVASEKRDRVQKAGNAVTERARQGYAFALDKTRPIRQAADYAKEKFEAVSEAIHDKTAARVHAGGKSAEKVADKITHGCGVVACKAEDLSASMAAKAHRGMSFITAKTAVVTQSSKVAVVAGWAGRASGA